MFPTLFCCAICMKALVNFFPQKVCNTFSEMWTTFLTAFYKGYTLVVNFYPNVPCLVFSVVWPLVVKHVPTILFPSKLMFWPFAALFLMYLNKIDWSVYDNLTGAHIWAFEELWFLLSSATLCIFVYCCALLSFAKTAEHPCLQWLYWFNVWTCVSSLVTFF